MSKKSKPDIHGLVYSTDQEYKFERENTIFETLPADQQKLRIKLDTKN